MPHRHSLPPQGPPALCAAAQRFRCEDVEFDLSDQHLWREGRRVVLTQCEWTVLAALARCGSSPMPRSTLLALLARTGSAPSANALNIHLCNLRQKVGRELIQTIRGRGYRLVTLQAIEVAWTTA